MATTKGSFVLYRMEHAYSMLLMKVTGATERTVSITYTTTVGYLPTARGEKALIGNPECCSFRFSNLKLGRQIKGKVTTCASIRDFT